MQSATARAIVTLAIYLGAATLPASSAQPGKTAAPKLPKSASKAKPAAKPETPFDNTIAKLPPGFMGNRVEWVLKNRTASPKGEFETTAEYNKRLDAFQSELYAFVPDDPIFFKYNADAETFSTTIIAGTTKVQQKAGWHFRAFNIHRENLSQSTYAATNAFGAEAVVTKIKSKVTQLVVADAKNDLDLALYLIPLTIKVPRELAQTAKPNLRIAFVCSIKPEQFEVLRLGDDVEGATGYDISKATIALPFEIWNYYIPLRVNLLQVWVFDEITGQVFGRFLPNGTQTDASAPSVQ